MTSDDLDSTEIAERWTDALDALFSSVDKPVVLHEPSFGEADLAYVRDCIHSGWVSSGGSYVTEFGEQLAAITGTTRAIPCVNGTAALHLCLKLCGVEAGHEVLVPSLTFVATANAVTYAHAVPHFVDSEGATLAVDPERLDAYLDSVGPAEANGVRNRKTGALISALLLVHLFGHAGRIDDIRDVCTKWNLRLIEDAAEGLGSLYKGRPLGSFGDASALSFNGNKIATTGGGGAVLTNDNTLGDAAYHLSTTAKRQHRYEFLHDEIGYNYRMPNLNAALGVAQLERLSNSIREKRKLAAHYEAALRGLSGAKFLSEPEHCESNYWLNAIVLDDDDITIRNAILDQTNDLGICTRPLFRPMHMLEPYKNSPRMADLGVSESLYARLINIPSSPQLAGFLGLS